jgi:hypothetical protein
LEHLSTPAPVDDGLLSGIFPRPNGHTQRVSISKTRSTVPSVDEFFDKTFPRRKERTQGVSISEYQSAPALTDDDMLAVFPHHYEYPWTQRQPTAAELWQQQSSRAEVDDNPYSLAHVPRRDTQSQYQATPTLAHVPRRDTQQQYQATPPLAYVPHNDTQTQYQATVPGTPMNRNLGVRSMAAATPAPATPMNFNLGVRSMAAATPAPVTPMNFNLGVRQIAAYDPAGSVFDERSIHQPRLLAGGFIPAGPIRPPPGLTHPDMAHPSDSPMTVRPSRPSPGHVRATPQVPSQSLLPYSPPTPRTVPRRFRVANIDTDTDPMVALELARVCNYKLCPMSDEC